MTMKGNEKGAALVIRDVYKRYTSDSFILSGLNMTVPSGAIYGLLGPSGCGKTTLLHSLIGLVKLDSGFVQFNVTKRSEIGYMPQSLCLHDQMTIKENCYFYGYLFGLSSEEIKVRCKELLHLLELPSADSLVKNLSGGQQKRVSIAVTFIHDPKILILDEPTVGLDPLLIESLWKHFIQLANNGKTIILTTHYIQEAHQAHKIGLMRNGVLLTEKAPTEIIKDVGCTNLEDAFLKLSCEQESRTKQRKSECPAEIRPFKVRYKNEKKLPVEKFVALTYKNAVLLKRDYILTSFILLLPGITMILSNLAIGGNLKSLKLGVVNEEVSSCALYDTTKCFIHPNETVYLSCSYIQFLKDRPYTVIDYPDVETARKDVKKNKITGVVYFPRNYTSSLNQKLDLGFLVDEATLDQTFLSSWVDNADPLIEDYLQIDLVSILQTYTKQSFVDCNLNPKIGLIPLLFEDPVYGSYEEDFVSYAMNGMMALCAFFFPAFMSLVYIFTEKAGGITDRIMATGISRKNVIAALMFFLIGLFVIELIEIIGITYFLFNLPIKGSFWSVITVLIFDGVAGLFLGLVLAVTYDDLFLATFTGGGALLALGFVSGLMWPIEGHHYLLRSFRWLMPVVETTVALREINVKGFSIAEFSVLKGYLSNVQWVCVFLSMTYLIVKVKKLNA